MTTVVVTQQPVANQMLIGSVQGHRDWNTDLFACFSDFKSCKYRVTMSYRIYRPFTVIRFTTIVTFSFVIFS